MIESIFEEGGELSQHIPGYRVRPGQMDLAALISESLIEKRHVLAEGPTGTGKSMAYGIPAAMHALCTGETVIVATANITLQEQLFHKDFPLISEVLGDLEFDDGTEVPPLRVQLIKGMGNYICKDKLTELEVSGVEEDWLDEISYWESTTETGDKSELDVEYSAQIWGSVAASPEECTKNDCKFFNQCYLQRARREEDSPHIIVTNYHMLYTDLLIRDQTGGMVSLLPDYWALVMDEVHEAVDIAMAFNGFELTAARLGWLSRAVLKVRDLEAENHYRMLRKCADRFFSMLTDVDATDILRRPLGFDGGLVKCLRTAAKFMTTHSNVEDAHTEDQKRAVARVRALISSFEVAASNIEDVAFGRENEHGSMSLPWGSVFYVERDRRSGAQSLCCKVVEVQKFLRDNIFSRRTVVGVSATLTTGGNFKFISKELGLGSSEFESMVVPSPFNPEQMLVVIPDVPPPKKRDEHTSAVCKIVCQVANDIGGRTMALFTSYRALNEVDKYVRGKLRGVRVLKQGDLPKSKIIAAFKEDSSAVILATASFWQGVDIPGEDLSCLIIDKFPFLPPSDPVLRYLEGMLELEGGSAFFDYSVPKAVIALKQGVGRLIRTETDFGVAVLCDKRIESTGYGKQFLRAFPKGHFKSQHGDINDVKAFLDEMRG
jgi:ATP-dependent DNA helicase DinG